jgi:CubicO group peptidase (beta-lactamase class C family)
MIRAALGKEEPLTVEPFATAAVPAELGLSAEQLAHLDRHLHGCVDVGMLPGVVSLVARHGRIAHLDSYGSMDLEAGRPMQPGTIFRMYSMTKPVVSVALMMLYEEGRFRLEEPVETFIPALADRQVLIGGTAARPELVPARRSITVRDLLTHTSGIIYPDEDDALAEIYRSIPASGRFQNRDLREFVEALGSMPLACHPASTGSTACRPTSAVT